MAEQALTCQGTTHLCQHYSHLCRRSSRLHRLRSPTEDSSTSCLSVQPRDSRPRSNSNSNKDSLSSLSSNRMDPALQPSLNLQATSNDGPPSIARTSTLKLPRTPLSSRSNPSTILHSTPQSFLVLTTRESITYLSYRIFQQTRRRTKSRKIRKRKDRERRVGAG